MSAVSPMVLLLLAVALVVGAAMLLVALGRVDGGIALPPRRRAHRRSTRPRDLG